MSVFNFKLGEEMSIRYTVHRGFEYYVVKVGGKEKWISVKKYGKNAEQAAKEKEAEMLIHHMKEKQNRIDLLPSGRPRCKRSNRYSRVKHLPPGVSIDWQKQINPTIKVNIILPSGKRYVKGLAIVAKGIAESALLAYEILTANFYAVPSYNEFLIQIRKDIKERASELKFDVNRIPDWAL